MGLGSANPNLADADTDLSKAKMAIAQNDYRTASLLLKQVFLDSLDGSEEDEQALKLSDEIYAKTNGRAIPVDYELPPELQGLKIRFIRRFQRPDDYPGGPSGGAPRFDRDRGSLRPSLANRGSRTLQRAQWKNAD
jgi:hypothetical protein